MCHTQFSPHRDIPNLLVTVRKLQQNRKRIRPSRTGASQPLSEADSPGRLYQVAAFRAVTLRLMRVP